MYKNKMCIVTYYHITTPNVIKSFTLINESSCYFDSIRVTAKVITQFHKLIHQQTITTCLLNAQNYSVLVFL